MRATSETPVSPEPPFSRLRSICAAYGLELDAVGPHVLERMRLLSSATETVNDCERIAGLAEDVFRYYEQERPTRRMTPLEQKTVVIGSLFSDVGKTGPATADASGQRLISEMFAIERVPDERMSVTRFFRSYFPSDADARAQRFRALGLDPAMSMREFWNMHSAWTLHIIQDGGMPPEAVAAAATHHLLENVNPDAIVALDGRFTRYFGGNERVDRPEKLVILLDKYDAARRRAHRTHSEAIAWLRRLVGQNARFRGDAEFDSLIDDLDVALREADRRGEYAAYATP